MSQRIAKPYPWYFRPLGWLLYGLARLPLSVLYVLAGGIYFLMAYVVRYRQRVVLQNLRNSFPEKPETEIRQIQKQFYRHFSQVIVEILKLAAINPAELKRRARITNPEVADRLMSKGRTALTLGSHMGNWEWILSVGALYYPGRAAGVYKPLMNAFFDDFMYRLRTATGADLIPMQSTLRDMVRNRHTSRSLALLTDQAAGPGDHPYWTTFMNQDTPFYTGADRMARQFDCPVLYVGIRRVKRGYYDITVAELHDGETPLPDDPNYLTEAFARHLERDMQASPPEYLWSHRRWKHKR